MSGPGAVWQMLQAFLAEVPDVRPEQLGYARILANRPLALDFAAAAACLDRTPEEAVPLLSHVHAAHGGKVFVCMSGSALRLSALRYCIWLEVEAEGPERRCVFSRSEFNWRGTPFRSLFGLLPRDDVRFLRPCEDGWTPVDVDTLERHMSVTN